MGTTKKFFQLKHFLELRTIFLGHKNLFGLNKIFIVKILAPKDPKNLAQQNFVQHKENVSAPKKLFDPTNCLAHVSFNLVRHIDKS